MNTTKPKVRLDNLSVEDTGRARRALIEYKVELEYDHQEETDFDAQQVLLHEIGRLQSSITGLRFYNDQVEIIEPHATLLINRLRLEATELNNLANYVAEQIAHNRSLENGWNAA